MRVPRIYTDQSLDADSTFELEPGPSQHMARVLRMQAGSELILFNGRGGEYPAVLTAMDNKRATVIVGERRDAELESPLSIHLGIAVSRGERMDWVVQKSTELGVRGITPLFSDRTEVRLTPERAAKKLRHWRQIAVSACEQCGRNTLPVIHPLAGLDRWLVTSDADCKLVLHHRAGHTGEIAFKPASIALLVGPEGGLDVSEIAAAETAGFRPLRLGPRVLRTETAPLAAIAILQARWGDMDP